MVYPATSDELYGRQRSELRRLSESVLGKRMLVIASNRGPVSFELLRSGEITGERGTGGVITALSAISQYANPLWVAAAMSRGDRAQAARVNGQAFQWDDAGHRFRLSFVTPCQQAYHWYYNRISNPLLWFLQHHMWDAPRTPTIDADTWQAWEQGYEAVNRMFAERIAEQVDAGMGRGGGGSGPLVMLHDYHLYRCAAYLRPMLGRDAVLHHFIHIPWPGADHWAMLPPAMREGIFRSLCENDVVGVQTPQDAARLVSTCAQYLPEAQGDAREGFVQRNGHRTWVRAYPISIDTGELERLAASQEVRAYRKMLEGYAREWTIVRIDRVEPSKNILRGFQAMGVLLSRHPEYAGRVKFLAFMVPSRLGIEQYQRYLTEISGAAEWINAQYGTGQWSPIELFVGENYPRAVAAMQLYDVLLVNPILDGMNLISKEGPTVNQRDGVLVLSDSAGSYEQLHEEALVVCPYDLVDTAEAMHRAMTMEQAERKRRHERMRERVMREDLHAWLGSQLGDIGELV